MTTKIKRQPPIWIYQLAAIVLAFISFAMSAYFSERTFERLPHLEDEVAYLYQAKMIARGDLVIETPSPRRAYWQPFIVDFAGKRFGKYPPGWPMLLSIGVLMGQAWVVNAFFAALNVALVYRFGRQMFNADVGLIAAGLMTFSPMALLLNATLMGHTTALFGATLFLYAYWRMERITPPLTPPRLRGGESLSARAPLKIERIQPQRRKGYEEKQHVSTQVGGTYMSPLRSIKWGVIAGVGLGMVIFNRPLTGVGVALPFVLWSGLYLLYTLVRRRELFVTRLKPHLALGIVALLFAGTIGLHNYLAVGDATFNLYTLVWEYDKIGFGEDVGREGHTLERGLRQTHYDLTLTAADLFGWQLGRITPELQDHLRSRSINWPVTGLSWVLLPFGVLLGWRRRWTYLLLAIPAALIALHVAYWIGAQRYSTRYYFEALSAVALLSALPVAWLARRTSRLLVYVVLTAVFVNSFITYSIPRIDALYRYNRISPVQIEQVQARRSDEKPLLVIITGEDVRWRAFGSLMAVTSPYLDSDIVVAWDDTRLGVRQAILDRFPDRELIDLIGNVNEWHFADAAA